MNIQRFNSMMMSVSLLVFLAGCAVTDIDRSVDFNRYKTYAWGPSEIEVKNPVYNSDLINKNIRTTVENEFAKRGIVPDKNNPDFLISYHTYTEKKESAGANRYGPGYPYYPFRFYPFGFGWGWFPYYAPYSTYEPRTFTEGTLIIDIADAKSKEVIWRGTVSGNVDNVKKLQKQIEKGIKAIMKKYPVTAPEKLDLPDDHIS